MASAEKNGWFVGRYVLMPDHLHLFARPRRDATRMRDWVKLWKSVSSRRIAQVRELEPPIWQSDYFDRYLRSSDDYGEKWRYVWLNPEVAELAPDPALWPYQGELHRLTF